jgi:hypothetical protein
MKRFLAIGSILTALVLGACGTTEEHKDQSATSSDEVPEILEVDLTVPETAVAGEAVTFTATVTQGEEIVEDADEVKFEVMNLSSGEKEMIEASLNKDKLYTIDYTFKANGTYDITSHVTARSMHTMPTKQISITGGEDDASEPDSEAAAAHGEDHHGSGATIEFNEGTASVGEAVQLETNVTLTEEPLEGARVQYDIVRSDTEQHTWLEAPEEKAGLYHTEFTFTEAGIYEIEVHVTKGDDIHEHVKKTYTVK